MGVTFSDQPLFVTRNGCVWLRDYWIGKQLNLLGNNGNSNATFGAKHLNVSLGVGGSDLPLISVSFHVVMPKRDPLRAWNPLK